MLPIRHNTILISNTVHNSPLGLRDAMILTGFESGVKLLVPSIIFFKRPISGFRALKVDERHSRVKLPVKSCIFSPCIKKRVLTNSKVIKSPIYTLWLIKNMIKPTRSWFNLRKKYEWQFQSCSSISVSWRGAFSSNRIITWFFPSDVSLIRSTA